MFLGWRPDEALDQDLLGFYRKLLEAINRNALRKGRWILFERTGWPGNARFQNLVTWSWVHDDERYLIAVNPSDCPVQAEVQVRGLNTMTESGF